MRSEPLTETRRDGDHGGEEGRRVLPRIHTNNHEKNETLPIANYSFLCYISFMNVTQTVDIPPSRQLTIDVPHEVPVGRTVLVFKPLTEASPFMTTQEAMDCGLGFGTGPRIDPAEAIKRCSGITKQFGFSLSSDDFIAMSRQDKELEDRLDSEEM